MSFLSASSSFGASLKPPSLFPKVLNHHLCNELYIAWDNYEDYTCRNFGRLVPAHSNSYRDKAKTRGSHLLGSHVGHHICPTYRGLRPFKKVLLVILGLLKFVQNSLIKTFETCGKELLISS